MSRPLLWRCPTARAPSSHRRAGLLRSVGRRPWIGLHPPARLYSLLPEVYECFQDFCPKKTCGGGRTVRSHHPCSNPWWGQIPTRSSQIRERKKGMEFTEAYKQPVAQAFCNGSTLVVRDLPLPCPGGKRFFCTSRAEQRHCGGRF